MPTTKKLLLALAAISLGAIGWGAATLASHLYVDHAKLHLIDQQVGAWQENARQQQQAQQGAGK